MKSLLGQVLDNYKYTESFLSNHQDQGKEIRTMEIICQSAGFKSGDFATVEILVDGRPQAIKIIFGRGMNVVVINSRNGQVIDTGTFDTRIFDNLTLDSSKDDSDDFAKWVDIIEPGFIVVIVCKDDCFESLTESAKQACESIGSSCIRKLSYRSSWCIIGEKGAALGKVPESLTDPDEGPSEIIRHKVSFSNDAVFVYASSLNSQSRFKFILPSHGRWLRLRKNDGALSRVPANFYPNVWQLLSKAQGLLIGTALLPRDPTVSEKTPEELNFGIFYFI